jgi:4-methylaminobutanoate oxidase (formaldehyde-forming)
MKRLSQGLVKDPEPFLFHAEIVLRDGVPVGYVTSGAYAFTLGGAAGLFILHADQPIDENYASSGP